MNKKAFSLIEVMVVIGIIALLATIAVPYYSDYANKSKVALAALVLNELNTKAIALYNEGLITPGMTALELDGISWTEGTVETYAHAPVTSAQMYFPSGLFLAANEWAFCVYVADLSFSGYGGAGGAQSRLCSKIAVDSGIFQTYCGRWEDGPNEIPLEYLPEECDNPTVRAAS